MKKSDLKTLIKPLVKECIHEVLIEEGLLSNVVAEVAKGMQGNLVVESTAPITSPRREQHQMRQQAQQTRTKMANHRKGLMDAIGADAYNGVNLFENTEPIRESKRGKGEPDLGHSSDPGVDISGLIGNAAQVWQSIK